MHVLDADADPSHASVQVNTSDSQPQQDEQLSAAADLPPVSNKLPFSNLSDVVQQSVQDETAVSHGIDVRQAGDGGSAQRANDVASPHGATGQLFDLGGGPSSALGLSSASGSSSVQRPPKTGPASEALAEPGSPAAGSARASGGAAGTAGGGVGSGRERSGASYVNANHLLNFQPSRPIPLVGGARGRGGGRGSSTSSAAASSATRRAGGGGSYDKYDKSKMRGKFLQANFRFLVSDAIEASKYEADADKMLDWDDVLEVEMAAAGPIQCPISLDSPPLCPQITPCGHIFSFPAIMHHLVHHGGDQLRRSAPCPLCFAPIVARELRLVRVRAVPPPPRAGDCLDLQLIRRGRASIIPQPVARAGTQPQQPQPQAEGGMAGTDGGNGAAAPQRGGKADGGGGSAKASAGDASSSSNSGAQPSAFDTNLFAKFVVVSEPMPLWRTAAEQLAACASQLVLEGGLEAAIEAPFVYGALDSLALRARRWAQNRAEQLQARGVMAAPPAPAALSAEAIGEAAEADVRKVFTGAVTPSSSKVGQVPPEPQQAKAAAPVEPVEDFPALPPPTPAPATARGGSGPPAQLRSEASAGAPAATAAADVFGAAGDEAQEAEQDPTCAAAAAAGPAPSSSPMDSSSSLLGTSPGSRQLNMPGSAGEYYTYQSADGRWAFLHPLNLRILLAHYGSYGACPPLLRGAPVLEVEDVVQGDATRRRWRFLGHLPLTGEFKLVEIQMAGMVPPEALAPFADELAARDKRRRKAKAGERRQAAAEAAAAARAAAARIGPSSEELLAMPALGAHAAAAGSGAGPSGSTLAAAAGSAAAALAREVALSADEIAESIALQTSIEEAAAAAAATASPPGSGAGVSFARITKMGYAATGPALSSSPPPAGMLTGAWGARTGGGTAAAPPGPGPGPSSSGTAAKAQGAWGSAPGAIAAAAGAGPGHGPWGAGRGASAGTVKTGPAAGGAPGSAAGGEADAGSAKKGSKAAKGVLLFSTSQRRY